MSDKDVFESIKRGLEEAIEFSNGKDTGAIVHHIDVPVTNVSSLRARLKMTQIQFAKSIGVSVGTLRGWEQGRRSPEGPARVLLALIDKKPYIVQDELVKLSPPSNPDSDQIAANVSG